MRLALVARISTTIAALAGAALLPPLALALWDGGGTARAFAIPVAASLLAGLAGFLLRNRAGGAAPRAADAIVAVGAAWVAVGIFGALPLWLSGALPSFTDAVFESVSGFTTTGATVFADVERLPRAINLWRCETHWLGGMGVIALVVALVPMLGIGGFRLMSAESTGPEKGRLTARITDTAKVLWMLYVGLTALQAVLLRLCGMGWTDAVCHAFSTLGTGGFSTRNASLAAFGSPAAEWVCTAFMLAASINFGIYYRIVAHRGEGVRSATEPRMFLAIASGAVLLVALSLSSGPGGEPVGRAIRLAAFQVASIISTTGFATADYDGWNPAAKAVLFALLLCGGCSGSTAGGVKVVRWTVLAKQAGCELRRLVHPRGVYVVRIDGMPVRDGLVAGVGAFLLAYMALCGVTALAGAAGGLHPWEAISASLSMVGNIGPAFGSLGPVGNYGSLPAALKWWYCFAMLAGRLEIYTMLLLVARLLVPSGSRGG